jgi:uncharacterized beta-barrel protein YwiB (DUF1934 family)
MQDVQIQLVVTHKRDGQTDVTKQEYLGKGVQKENGWYISYKEQFDEIGEVGTILKIAELDVTLLRQGKLQSKQLFAKGRSSDSVYSSPYGQFQMETHTRQLRIKRENGRPQELEISYQLWLNQQYLGEYEMKIRLAWA